MAQVPFQLLRIAQAIAWGLGHAWACVCHVQPELIEQGDLDKIEEATLEAHRPGQILGICRPQIVLEDGVWVWRHLSPGGRVLAYAKQVAGSDLACAWVEVRRPALGHYAGIELQSYDDGYHAWVQAGGALEWHHARQFMAVWSAIEDALEPGLHAGWQIAGQLAVLARRDGVLWAPARFEWDAGDLPFPARKAEIVGHYLEVGGNFTSHALEEGVRVETESGTYEFRLGR